MARGRGNDVDSGIRCVRKRKGEQRAGLALLRKKWNESEIQNRVSKINELLTAICCKIFLSIRPIGEREE